MCVFVCVRQESLGALTTSTDRLADSHLFATRHGKTVGFFLVELFIANASHRPLQVEMSIAGLLQSKS